MTTLWRDALVLTMDESVDGADGSTAVRRDVLVDGAVIVDVAEGIAAPASADVVDARDLLLTPGLVNAHTHSWEVLLRGSSEGLPLELWSLMSYPPSGVEPLPERLVYLRTAVAALESLRGGTTAVLDDVGELPLQSPAALERVFHAYAECGIRATCTGTAADIALVDRLPRPDEIFPADLLDRSRSALRPSSSAIDAFLRFSADAVAAAAATPGDLVAYAVGPSAPHRCSDDLFRACHAFAAEYDLVLHTHLLETRLQAEVAQERWGRTAVEHLADLGVLDQRLVAAHGIWLSAGDKKLLGQSGATVAHNPLSNLKLGSGRLDWRGLHDDDVRVALGTDGASSSDTLRMLEVIKAAALGHTVDEPRRERWPRAGEVLRAATATGARALRSGAGVIAPGRPADLVVFDLSREPAFIPLHDPVRQLVYSENGSSIAEVWVAGECVIREGRSTRVDDAELLAEFRQEAERWLTGSLPAVRERTSEFAPAVTAAYDRATRSDLDAPKESIR